MNFTYDLLVRFHFERVERRPTILENPKGMGIYEIQYRKLCSWLSDVTAYVSIFTVL